MDTSVTLASYAILVMLTTSVICAVVRLGHICNCCKDNPDYYFPARRRLAVFFLVSGLCVAPYLLHPDSPDTLLCISILPLLVCPITYAFVLDKFFFKAQNEKGFIYRFHAGYIPYATALVFFVFALIGGDFLIREELSIRIGALLIGAYNIIYLTYIERLLFLRAQSLKGIKDAKKVAKSAITIYAVAIVPVVASAIFGWCWWMTVICCVVFSAFHIVTLLTFLTPHVEYKFEEKIQQNNEPDLARWCREKGYCRSDVYMDTLAAELGTDRQYLSEYVKKEYGTDFRNWIGKMRIAEAQRILTENPEIQIEVVAGSVGMSSASALIHLFQKHVGMTPREWQKSTHTTNN